MTQWISRFGDKIPQIHDEAYVDISARIIGQVEMAAGSSVWPCAVLRADTNYIRLGEKAAVLDLALVESPEKFPVEIGPGALVSHRAAVHGAIIEPNSLVGIGAIVLDGARIGEGSIIGAGAVVPPGRQIPPNSLVLGIPGKIIRQTTPDDHENLKSQIAELYEKSRQYMAER